MKNSAASHSLVFIYDPGGVPYHLFSRPWNIIRTYCKRFLALTASKKVVLYFLSLVLLSFPALSQSNVSLPFTAAPLNGNEDLSALMVQRVDQFLTLQTEHMKAARSTFWNRDFTSPEAFNASVSSQRKLLSQRLGVVDARVAPKFDLVSDSALHPFVVETPGCIIQAVRWKVLDDLTAEGLLMQPKGKVRARLVMIPDADVLPEVLAGLQSSNGNGYGVARQLAEAGYEIVIPTLISRDDAYSGNASLGLFTNMPHREWIYRQAYEVGRHVIGYELQKIFSAIDWFQLRTTAGSGVPIGVAGYGEGGLLALYAAALDTRISSTLVSGYFNNREQLYNEPIYRNVFGLLKYFGDAELAVMAWPRHVVIEQAQAPEVPGPPTQTKRRSGAAPGALSTPDFTIAKSEWSRATEMLPADRIHIQWCSQGNETFHTPFSSEALMAFVGGLQSSLPKKALVPLRQVASSHWIDANKRQERMVRDMEDNVQNVLIVSERHRNENFWIPLTGDTATQAPVKAAFRQQFWNQLGQLPVPAMSINPKARLLQKTEKWTSYEVVLDVWPGVFAWGILLLPNDLKPAEKRPVVVCQHGLEGVPMDVVTTDPHAENYHFYKGFASHLADKGYVVFAPYNLYRGKDKFRVLQRKANPLGLTLFSVIIGQHQRIVEWLQQLPFVDPARIAFYGLSYGGKSAMRIPAVVQGYALSICSGDFNEWIRKCASTQYSFSYLYTGEYDMQEWDLGHTFSYAEMAGLIAPRPFMVERGHYDNVAADEWVGYEFAKVKRHYDLLGIPNSTDIEFFAGPHTVHGVGTFEFLDHFLKKEPEGSPKKGPYSLQNK